MSYKITSFCQEDIIPPKKALCLLGFKIGFKYILGHDKIGTFICEMLRIWEDKIQGPECVIASIYFKRIVDRVNEKGIYLFTPEAVRRLLLACLTIACKFYNEHIYFNQVYASASNLPIETYNGMELQTLKMLNYKIFVSVEEYFEEEKCLEEYFDHFSRFIEMPFELLFKLRQKSPGPSSKL
ncbi:cyclin [Thermoproteota archaeon]